MTISIEEVTDVRGQLVKMGLATAIRNRVLYAPGGILAPSGERFRTLADPSSSGLLTLRFKRLRIR